MDLPAAFAAPAYPRGPARRLRCRSAPVGSLLAADLYLTEPPLLAGRSDEVCLGLVEGTVLLPDVHRDARLLSVRHSVAH